MLQTLFNTLNREPSGCFSQIKRQINNFYKAKPIFIRIENSCKQREVDSNS